VSYLPQVASNQDPLNLSLLSSWDYRRSMPGEAPHSSPSDCQQSLAGGYLGTGSGTGKAPQATCPAAWSGLPFLSVHSSAPSSVKQKLLQRVN
jgi:hypothetical protein